MNPLKHTSLSFALPAALAIGVLFMHTTPSKLPDIHTIHTREDVLTLFNVKAADLPQQAAQVMADAEQRIKRIIDLKSEARTFENTVVAFDYVVALSPLALFEQIVHLLKMTHPDQVMRETAHTLQLKLSDFFIRALANNIDLYHALDDYAQHNRAHESLSEEQNYYLDELLLSYQLRVL